MSSRALRRLNNKNDLEQFSPAGSELESTYTRPKQAANLFALIGQDDDDDGDDINGNSEEESEEYKYQKSESSEPIVIDKKSSQKKKNKKKKKNEKKQVDQPETNNDDDLDQILLELQKNKDPSDSSVVQDESTEDPDQETHEILDPSFQYFTALKQLKSASVLKINAKDLDPDNEFKNLFGNLSVEAIEDANSTTSTSVPPEQLQQIKKLSKLIRGWGGRDRRSIPGTSRKLILTKIRDDWFPTNKKDISMEDVQFKDLLEWRLENSEDWEDVIRDEIKQSLKNGINYYKFDRTTESLVANSQFFTSVVTHPNHENLMSLLSKFPYHVETILQVALILIRQGDKSNSNGLIERALFAFDRGFKPNFDLTNGLTRLPFQYYLNRQFYLTLFRYIEVLSKKGTYFTALTYCKLLLALSPAEDPYGVRYFIDFYAILANEYKYLIELVESPLVKTYAKWFTPGLAYSTVLAFLKLNDEAGAKKAIKKAYIKYPYAGLKLLEAIGLSGDIPLKDYSIFAKAGEETELSTEAYLIRAPIVWNDSKDRKFLHDSLLELVKQNIKTEPSNGIIPKNFLRFVILSGEGKLMAKIPKEIWDTNDIYEFDVLPPENGERLENFIDNRFLNQEIDDERLLEMVRNLSLQEMIDQQVE